MSEVPPYTLHLTPETRDPRPEARNPKPETRNPNTETRNPAPHTIHPQHSAIEAGMPTRAPATAVHQGASPPPSGQPED